MVLADAEGLLHAECGEASATGAAGASNCEHGHLLYAGHTRHTADCYRGDAGDRKCAGYAGYRNSWDSVDSWNALSVSVDLCILGGIGPPRMVLYLVRHRRPRIFSLLLKFAPLQFVRTFLLTRGRERL